jgi:TonB family protein
MTLYNSLTPFGTKLVPRDLTETEQGTPIIQLHMESLEAPTSPTTVEIVLPHGEHDLIDENKESDGLITPPHLIAQCQPQLSDEAQAKHLSGTVIMTVQLDIHGHVRYATVTQSAGQDLDAAAVAAAYKSEFQPGIFRGKRWSGGPIKMVFRF